MHKGIFITATGTDVGKTYITARIIKGLIGQGINAGYYVSRSVAQRLKMERESRVTLPMYSALQDLKVSLTRL